MDPVNPVIVNPEVQIPEKPQNDSRVTIVSMAAFILLSIGIVAFLYYQNQQLKEMLKTYQTQTITPTPVATMLETASPSATPIVTKTSPTPNVATSSAKPKACTMEAKLCSNGSYVGRTGPNCEFAPCPTP